MAQNRVVVGVDGSNGARRAIEWAATHAERVGGEVVAVYILTYDQALMSDLPPIGLTKWRESLHRELNGPWTAPLRDRGVRHRALLLEDESVAKGLMKIAEAEDVELVVLGAHGEGNLAHRLLGAVTYRVSHNAHRPVVIVPVDWTASELRT